MRQYGHNHLDILIIKVYKSLYMLKIRVLFSTLFCWLTIAFLFACSSSVYAASVSVSGKAKALNTDYYLDFTNYNSNVVIDDQTGNFSGYAFLEDYGWADFGTTDNSLGPVNVNLTSGAVTGKAKVLNTSYYIDFTNYSSNVTVNITSGAFSGYGFSEDAGWLDFTDTGVTSASTLDAVAPLSFNLESPGNNNYLTNERPTLKWKTTTDATSGMSKYKLEIDNGDEGDFTIDNIPISRTSGDNYRYETDKYLADYQGFEDSDSTNNYISLYTKSSSEWDSSENEGKFKEGRRTWKVKAVDNVGNERAESRTLFLDRTSPSLEPTQINETAFIDNLASTDATPTIFGRITDVLNGDTMSGSEPDQNKAASGPDDQVEIKIEKKDYLGSYQLHTLAVINLNQAYWAKDGSKINDNSKNTSNKHSPFSFTPSESLSLGTYRITLTAKDLAGNESSTSFTLNIKSFAEMLSLPGVEEALKELEEETGLPREELEEMLQDKGIIMPEELKEPSKIIEFLRKLVSAGADLWWTGVNGGKKAYLAVLQGSSNLLAYTSQKVKIKVRIQGNVLAMAGSSLEKIYSSATGGYSNLLAYRRQRIEDQKETLGNAYFQLTQSSSGMIKNGLLAVAAGADQANKRIEAVLNYASKPALAFKQPKLIDKAVKTAQQSISQPASEEALAFTNRLKIGASTFIAIVFDEEPTRISNVKVAEAGEDYAVITWTTNHYATSKVNYGTTFDYGSDIQSDERVKEHKIKITGLKSGKKYTYEVMSQGKNYVYDAKHEFTTPSGSD